MPESEAASARSPEATVLEAGSSSARAGKGAPLDEVMLAMDVVDTLRHRQQLVAQELGAEERDEEMLARLRQIYAAQGIEVPDRILREGVSALREERFVYKPSPPSAARSWALLYVNRGRWARVLLVLAIVLAGALYAYDAAVRAPRRALATDLQTSRSAVLALAESEALRQQAGTLYQQGTSAIAAGDHSLARANLQTLDQLLSQLRLSYSLFIVSEPDTGVWRIPDVNSSARNFYIIVEAIDQNGRRLTLPIRNEETGQLVNTTSWGLRVDEATFEAVAADKLDDGIIQQRLFGQKSVGFLEPDYFFNTTGAAITAW